MLEWLQAHKPAASRRTHLLLAATLWSVVGTVLLSVGVWWSAPRHVGLILLPIAVLVGGLKGRFVIGRVARRTITRIEVRGNGRCLGGVFSVWTWGMIAAMSCAGQLLRSGSVPRTVVGLVYTAVGTGLVMACRQLWHAWHAARLPV